MLMLHVGLTLWVEKAMPAEVVDIAKEIKKTTERVELPS